MKKYFILFLISLCAANVVAQSPTWSVKPSDYQYSMTFTAFLNINGTTLSSPEDKVVALANGEVRGVGNVTYVASVDKYVVYMSVYANTSNETIIFLIYNSANQSVYEVIDSQKFVIDGNVGGIFQSYSIASPALSNNAVLNSFGFSGVTPVSQTINNHKIDIVLPANTDVTNLKAEFSVSSRASFFVNTAKQISGVSDQDFTTPIIFKLLSENEAELIEYEVSVTLENPNIEVPQLLLTTNTSLFLNQSPVLIHLKTDVVISGFTADDVLLTNAFVLSINKVDQFNFALQIVPIIQGDFSIEIPQNKVFNAENEGNLASNKLVFTYDIVNPYIKSIKRKNPINELTKSAVLEFKVTFSEVVENVISTSFKSVSGAVFTVNKESDTIYNVTIGNVNNVFGAVSLSIKSTNSIQDKAGNLLLNSVINVRQN